MGLRMFITEQCLNFADRDMIFIFHCPSNPMLKGSLSGLRQFLENESFLKMMKNAFDFTSKALFIIKIFKFLS